MAANMKEKVLFQPETIECWAILHGLQQCIPLGIPHLVVDSNCQSIVQQLQDTVEIYLPLGNIIKDIRQLMASFQTYIVQYQNRTNNKAAHCLTKKA